MDIRITGDTLLFPVVGDPIGQVKSPVRLSQILADRGFNGIVIPVQVESAGLGEAFDGFNRMLNLRGLLVTVPHKHAAFPHCKMVSDRARFLGAVNVMRKSADGWAGDMTDGQGYVDGILRAGGEISGRSALLVGCGGAGFAIALELLDRGVAALHIHDVDAMRRDVAVARLSACFPGRVRQGTSDPSGFDLVADATTMGMQPDDPLPVEVDRLLSGQFVASAVTRPAVPPLLVEARRRGCATMTGEGMFEAQAERLVDFLLAGDESVPSEGRSMVES